MIQLDADALFLAQKCGYPLHPEPLDTLQGKRALARALKLGLICLDAGVFGWTFWLLRKGRKGREEVEKVITKLEKESRPKTAKSQCVKN
jgi:hypothetical protein